MTSSTDEQSRKHVTGKNAPFASIVRPPSAVWWRDGWQLTAASVRHTLRSPRWQIGLAVVIVAGVAGGMGGWLLSSTPPGAYDEPAALFIGPFGVLAGFVAALLVGLTLRWRDRTPRQAWGITPVDSRNVFSGDADPALADVPTETYVRAVVADLRERLPLSILNYLSISLLMLFGVCFFVVAGGSPLTIGLMAVMAISNGTMSILALKLLGSHGALLGHLGSARHDAAQNDASPTPHPKDS
ncbi:hypothetical protein SAMN06309945_1863 [Okibacterium fritillariae]|uniref:Uncharacterized protein n=1 Tax=Okibacterium fritillariae TaxID=123320 RepID=A0A1T5JTR5_9MICO|nr:hypothetical protein SAMN06309945_1863 [Okibacterium fritillariae]